VLPMQRRLAVLGAENDELRRQIAEKSDQEHLHHE
jgi:hypothetical protein